MKIATELQRFVAPSLTRDKGRRFAADKPVHAKFEPGLRRMDALFFAKQHSKGKNVRSFIYDARTGAASWLETNRF